MSAHTPGPVMVQTGNSYSELKSFTAAEVAVLQALALGEELDRADVRLSSVTRADREQPWALCVHSRTARRLEDRGFVLTKFARRYEGDNDTLAELTSAGREALAAIAKAEGRS